MKKDVGEGNPSTLRFDIVCSAYVADVLFRQVGVHHVFLEDVGDCTCLFRRGFSICCFEMVALRWFNTCGQRVVWTCCLEMLVRHARPTCLFDFV